MHKKTMLIGLAGFAGTGKDTLYKLIKEIAEKDGDKFTKVAFADQLKKDLIPIANKMGVHPFTEGQDEKRLLRPIMVAYGEAQRKIDPMYWVERVENSVNYFLIKGINICITDTRYENEAGWIQAKGIVVYLNRRLMRPPNEVELKNNALVKAKADLIVDWQEMTEKKQKETARKIYKEIINAYNKKFGIGPQYENRQPTSK